MRQTLIVVMILSLACLSAPCQEKEKSISAYTTFYTDNGLLYPTMIGSGVNLDESSFSLLGVEGAWQLKKNLSVAAGVEYARHKITVSYWMDNPSVAQPPDNKGQLDMVSLPVSLRLSFLKFFFVQAGIITDIQTKNNLYNKLSSDYDVVNDQSGIGSLFNIGAFYRFKNISVFSGLYNEIHGLIFFKGNTRYDKMQVDAGFQIGMRYHFKTHKPEK